MKGVWVVRKIKYGAVAASVFELVPRLSPDEQCQMWRILATAFKQCRNGEPVTMPDLEPDSLLNIVIEDAMETMATGAKNYIQRMTAVEIGRQKKERQKLIDSGYTEEEIQRITDSGSPIDHRLITDRSANNTIHNTIEYNSNKSKDTLGKGDMGENPVPVAIPKKEASEDYFEQARRLETELKKMNISLSGDVAIAANRNMNAALLAVEKMKSEQLPKTSATFLSVIREFQ